MRSCTMRRVVPVLLALSAVSVVGLAQTNTTSFSGTVADASGARLPGATVSVQDMANGMRAEFITHAQGDFSFAQIRPGKYTVTIRHDGFADQVSTIELFIATPLTHNFTLSAGATQVLEVTSDLGLTSLNTTDAALGKAFNNDLIQTLPYLANNTLSLLALQPGAIAFDATNTGDTRAGTINGARQDQTNLTLDGVDNNDANYGYAFTGVLRATRDSIEEFRVTTSGANADSGRSSGAQVALQTKSGTNSLHGSAYYYYRGPATASNNWFLKQSQLLAALPNRSAKVLQDTFGATLGLPVHRDKLFFFGAYEGYKQASRLTQSRTVPLGLRNGTVSYLNTGGTTTTLSSAQIASLDKGCAAGGGCPAGPGVNAAAVAFMKQYPVSNSPGGDSLNTSGYVFSSPAPVSQFTNIVRLDYNLNSKQSVFVRGNLQSDNSLAALQFDGGVPTSNTYGNNRGIAAGYIYNISDRLVNNLRYGWTRFGSATRGGVTSDYVTFAALSALTPTTSSTLLVENTNNFIDDFTIIRGRHVIQMGGNDRLVYNQRTLTNTLFRNASVTPSYLSIGSIANTGTNLDASAGGFAKIASSFSTSYDQAITAATGLITYASQYVNYKVANNALTPLATGTVPTRKFRNFEQEYYVQDQWKITQNFTLTAGLRYAYLGVPYEVNGQEVRPTIGLSSFLANRVAGAKAGTSYNTTVQVVPGGKANHAPDFWTAQAKNFSPRIAFNYAPGGKTSIRGGFMIAYDHFGQAAVNTYNDSYSFGLSSQFAAGVAQKVDTAPRFTSASAVPLSITPTPSAGGAFPVTNLGGLGYITQSFDDHLRTPYSEIFNLSVQREVSKGLTVTGTYVGRLGRHLLLNNDVAMPLNLVDTASGQDYFGAMTQLDKYYDQGIAVAAVPNIAYWQNMFPKATYKSGGKTYTGTQAVYGQLSRGNETATLYDLDGDGTSSPAGQSFRYFHPQFSSLYAQSSIGVSNYNALQLSVRHTVNKNFIYDLNYTLSKALDQGSAPERGGSSNPTGSTSSLANTVINTFNPSQMYAAADFDARHAINGDWTILLPYGRGQRFGGSANRLVDGLLGGWTLTGVAKFNSALPFSAVGYRGWGTNWDIRSYDVQIAPVNNTGHHNYNTVSATTGAISPNAFTDGAAKAFSSFRQAYVGESGQRNTLRADGYFSVDPGLSKSISTFEHQSFRVSVEVFNVTNAIRYAAPGSGSSSPTTAFGRYSTLLNSPRQMQFSGRYYF